MKPNHSNSNIEKRLYKNSLEYMDSEGYHAEFDKILEERLMELDPEFMKFMQKLYEDSGCSRWYA